uniref:Paired domain-containing protein n=1 Tax=Acrobeloides nanus TaxID=290746 RepID=A0A914BY56_9BILA
MHPTLAGNEGVQPRSHILSLGDFSWEYATYLLLNQTTVSRDQQLIPNPIFPLPFVPQFLPANINFKANSSDFKQQSSEPSASNQAPSNVTQRDQLTHVTISKNKLGRSYNPGRPLGMADRQRILQLYEKGHKISHIARIIGVTHSCVSKIMTRYRRTGSMHPRSAQQSKKLNLFDNVQTSILPIPRPLLTLPTTVSLNPNFRHVPSPLSISSQVSSTTDTALPDSFIHKPIPIKSYSITTLLN